MKNCPTCHGFYPANIAFCPNDGNALVETQEWSEGAVVRGKYRILGKVGQGGMGAVYKALHLRFNEVRALKVISSELSSDPSFVKRFEQEAVNTRRLQHPNAVRVDDIDEAEDGRPFIIMEFIEGHSLKKLIQDEGPLPVARVCAIIKQAASALAAAHELGMVHRDIKPENIVLVQQDSQETAKVLDFGIAKLREARAGESRNVTLTGAGVVVGTPQYMSPEQAMGKRGEDLDGRSDLYSLGIVMYQMLTGELPFKADTTLEILLAHLQTPPAPITEVRPGLRIPQNVARLAMRCLEKTREQRPASAAALIEEIDRAQSTSSVQLGALGPAPPTRVSSPASGPSPGGVPGTRTAAGGPARSPVAVNASARSALGTGAHSAPQPFPAAPASKLSPRSAPSTVTPPVQRKQPRWRVWALLTFVFVTGGGLAYHSMAHRTEPSQFPTGVAQPGRSVAAAAPAESVQGPAPAGAASAAPEIQASIDAQQKPVEKPRRSQSAPSPAVPAEDVKAPAPTPPAPAAEPSAQEHLDRARALTDKKRFAQAEHEYRAALQADPGNADAHLEMANLLSAKGQKDAAVSECREAIRLSPQKEDAHGMLAGLLWEKTDLDGALAELRTVIGLNPKNGDAHLNAGWILDQKGDGEGALVEYQIAARLIPENADAHLALGGALDGRGNAEAALAEYHEATHLKPDYAEAHNALGALLEKKEDVDGALAEFREAVRLKADYAEAHYNLGALLEKKSDRHGALEQYRMAVKLDPNNGDYRSALKGLEGTNE